MTDATLGASPLVVNRDSKAWKQYSIHDIPTPPSMLAEEEFQFLHHLGKDRYTGGGEIIDAGAFLGASAAALASGFAKNDKVAKKQNRIYSYDFFECAGFHQNYIPQFKKKNGDDVLDVFRHYTAPYAAMIVPVKGNICHQTWDGRPIEILFVDFTQTWQHHTFVVRTFYRHLVPGQSILVHQDYCFTVCYWLHIFMEYYWDHFELISPKIMNSTAAWVLKTVLPAEAFANELNEQLPFEYRLALLDQSIVKYDGVHQGLIKCARARMLLRELDKELALYYAARLAVEYRDQPSVMAHVRTLIDEIGRSERPRLKRAS